MTRSVRAISLGLSIAAVGVVIYVLFDGAHLEEDLGLTLLFKQRGSVPAPAEVAIVTIDKVSADGLGLPNDPEKWPRSLHAELIDKLVNAGAAVIVFDIYFKEQRSPAEDGVLAKAMRRAGNVILFSYIKRETLPISNDASGSAVEATIDRVMPPTPGLAEAALALAPFTLPKVPVRVSRFWTFRPSTGELPTMPAVTLQLHALDVYPDLLALISELRPGEALPLPRSTDEALAEAGLVGLVASLRAFFNERPALAQSLLDKLQREPTQNGGAGRRERFVALLKLYQGDNARYLNFYGPPRSITTVPYIDVLTGDAPSQVDFQGKVVFIGFSERLQPEQKDGFYTVFSQTSGLDLSGVEIAATAFANLFEGKTIVPLNPVPLLLLIMVFGISIAAVCRLLPTSTAIVASVVFAGTYLGVCFYFFRRTGAWLPVVIPVFLQTPLALFVSVFLRYAETNRERKRIRQAFGYYLPNKVVDQLAHSAGGMQANTQLLYGICLATDAEQYTRLAESMDPQTLAELMNKYYGVLFEPVRARAGIISDVVGDAMLAIWSATRDEPGLRSRACEAALEITEAAKQFNRSLGGPSLPTRIGLHAGQIMVGNIGAMDHYEYRAVGDIVNTASRIQGLNKQLGTRILASQVTLAGLDGFVKRELGSFKLAGKQQVLALYELLCCRENETGGLDESRSAFAEGLAAFRAGAWEAAAEEFLKAIEKCASDGPANFYLRLCRLYIDAPPPEPWDGVVCIDQK